MQKKTDEEKREQQHNYNIFMTIIDKVGHDKRGADMLKRDKNGEVLYFPRFKLNEKGDMETYEVPELDDQTIEVPEIFKKWKKEEGLQW